MASIDVLELSVRVYNVLRRAGINTVEQLEEKTDHDLRKIRNLSHKGVDEIRRKLEIWKKGGVKMRLIDADALNKYIESEFEGCTVYDMAPSEAVSDFQRMVDMQPTVDVVLPVVRCKDCLQWGRGIPGETEHVKVCDYGGYMVGENGFCVYGEKK
jgi:DNA polymerase/3'-5' exonuclease PolX